MESRSRNKIIVILGPTSSGKSDVAIKLARKFNGEIISADSRQIYKGMDLGTGKVSKAQQRLARHQILDIISPNTEYNVSKFKKDAIYAINCVLQKGELPIICGGTGFWIKSIVDDIDFPEVKPDKDLRKKLEKETAEKLFSLLKKLDPERAKNIDAKNKIRIIRAIEICKTIGKVPKKTTPNIQNTKYDFLQIGIDIPKEKLHKKIKTRLEKRFKQGMLREIEKLHKNGVSWKRLESFGLEYRWIARYLQDNISRKEMEENLYNNTKNYAKRQMTWFKKDKRIIWLKNYKEIEKNVKNFIS